MKGFIQTKQLIKRSWSHIESNIVEAKNAFGYDMDTNSPFGRINAYAEDRQLTS
ncbi:hypothetical protein [Vibrio phage phiKT1024]|nr:hypothetical protein [Vibrio phage phiKT1024]